MKRRNFLAMVGGSTALLLQSNIAKSATSPMAGGVFYTKGQPGRWAAKAATHIPQVQATTGVTGTKLIVYTPHPMNGSKHYIVKHVILDQNFKFGAEKLFTPFADTQAKSTFELANYHGVVYVMSVCNLHDTWLTAVTV